MKLFSNPIVQVILGVLIEQAQRLGFGQKVSIVDQPVSAWKQWWARVNDGDFVCIAGSVFLLAELRSLVIADCQGRAKSG
jgi:folylpolyglutamate synthase/dihydropteroate synthase